MNNRKKGMQMGRKTFILAVVIMVTSLYFPLGASAQKKIKIGILRFSEQAHYIEGQRGILEQLKQEGFDETNVDFDIRDAGGNKDKVAEIAKVFLEKKMDLIMPLGTPAAIGVAKEIKDIPIVFAHVFDPVGSGIANSWQSSGNNITGASTWVEMKVVVKVLREISLCKRIGVLFTEEEKQTLIQLDEFKKLQTEMDFMVIPAAINKPEDTGSVVSSLVGKVDAIFVTGGTVVGKGLAAFLEVAINAKIPTATHLQERSEAGVLLAITGNSFKIGELAGEKAVQVLRGKKPADIPIEHLKTYDIVINLKTAKKMGVDIPVSLLKIASKVIKNE